MHEWLGALCLAGATLTLASSSLAAACAPADLAGRWDAYSVGVDDDGEPFWERCGIRFASNAQILSGTSCRTDTDDASTLSGQFVVNTNCRVTAAFTQQFPGEDPNTCSIPQATLSRDKEIVTGVGRCGGGATIFSFSMIRR